LAPRASGPACRAATASSSTIAIRAISIWSRSNTPNSRSSPADRPGLGSRRRSLCWCAQAFNDKGWFRSGDLGRYVDEDRNIQLTGRSKEIINRGGKKFFPREVEEILYTHPKILHAAMIGLPDPRLGEKNCLCVVLKGLETLALSEVVAFLKGQVADYKLPEVLYVLEELPMTGTGKVRRPILQEQVAGIETAPAKLWGSNLGRGSRSARIDEHSERPWGRSS
jgi:acyl-CoA synthetase (AMP-forming)/AMP-acid ligase II